MKKPKRETVQIVEVGPRDGLQNESRTLHVETRLQFIKMLVESGLKRIEVGAFVSPKWVPQMAHTSALVEKIRKDKELKKKETFKRLSVLVPNMHGMADAMESGVKDIAVFGSCSESFSQKNINCSIEQSFQRFTEVLAAAEKKKIAARGYLSMAFGCPYEGKVDPDTVVDLVRRMLDLGIYEVSIGDTIGVATPRQVEVLLEKLLKYVEASKLAMHFHDTRGTALANVLKSFELGVRIFDTSCGGLGGCPYAKGASGNLATEDLVYMFEGMDIDTGVDLKRLIGTSHWMENPIGRKLSSRVSQADLPTVHTF